MKLHFGELKPLFVVSLVIALCTHQYWQVLYSIANTSGLRRKQTAITEKTTVKSLLDGTSI